MATTNEDITSIGNEIQTPVVKPNRKRKSVKSIKSKKKKQKSIKSTRPLNAWMIHYNTWRRHNEEFMKNNKDVKLWVAEAKKTYSPIVKTMKCSNCGHNNII